MWLKCLALERDDSCRKEQDLNWQPQLGSLDKPLYLLSHSRPHTFWVCHYLYLVYYCQFHFQLFVELNELITDKDQEMRWKERARWIKFEEDVEEETDRWGKPHVASLSFRSLLELRRTITQGKREIPNNSQ